MKKRSKLKWVGLTLAGLGATMSGSAIANMRVDSHGGLNVFDPAEKAYWFNVGGLLQLDEVIFAGSSSAKKNDFPSGANIRRAWVDFRGGVGEFWSYRLVLDFRGDPVVMRDAYVNFAGIQNTNIAAGQFFIPSGLENWGDKKNLLFLEQSLMGSAFLAPEFGLGLYADTHFVDMVTLAAAVYQPRQISNTFGMQTRAFNSTGGLVNDVPRDDRIGAALRATVSPCHTEDTVYHLGASVKHQRLVSTGAGGSRVFTNLFQTPPEAIARTTALLVNAGPIRAKDFTVWGLEAAGMMGPAMIQAEYAEAGVSREKDASDIPAFTAKRPRFRGYHVQGAYVITGESHSYDFPSGTFGGVKPTNDCGAWEVAARYSHLSLNSQDIYGGKENNLTLGLNWYATENVKLVFNYIRANIKATNTDILNDRIESNRIVLNSNSGAGFVPPLAADRGERRLDIFGVRFQVAF